MQDHWSQTLETLIDWLVLNETLSDAHVVRRFMDVLSRAPNPDLLDGLGRLDAATVDQLLAAGAADMLALRLIGDDSGFFASRGASGEYLVSVMLAGRNAETTAAGSTLARATVCALAMTLSQPEPAGFAPEDFVHDRGYTARAPAPGASATLH